MLKPLNNFIIVEVQKVERKTASGIFIAGSDTIDTTNKGNVVAVGNNVKDIKDGDIVLFTRDCGIPVKFDEKDYLILNQDKILAVVE